MPVAARFANYPISTDLKSNLTTLAIKAKELSWTRSFK